MACLKALAEEASGLAEALMEASGEAVLVLDGAGRVLALNPAAEGLLGPRAAVGADVRDLVYTGGLERVGAGELPLEGGAGDTPVTAVMEDGTLLPAVGRLAPAPGGRGVLSLRPDAAHEAVSRRRRLGAETARLHARLDGVLSIVSSAALGEGTLEALSSDTAERLQASLGADAAAIYLADEYGFTLYGASSGFRALGIDGAYVPMGAGVPTLVSRNRRATRLQLVMRASGGDAGATMLDIDADTRLKLRSALASRCSTIVGAPVFSYDRVVAVVVAGWTAPCCVPSGDVRLLETVSDFLSVQFAAAVTQIEQRRQSGFTSALAAVRDIASSEGEVSTRLAAKVAGEVGRAVPSRILIMESNPYTGSAVVRLRDEARGNGVETLDCPRGMAGLFEDGLRVVPVAPGSPCGMWVARHTNLSSGFAVQLASADASEQPLEVALLVMRGLHDRPFDDEERAFLEAAAKEVDATLHAEQERAHDAEISRALQAGLRNVLPEVKGLTTSSLYISATESAVVGGDFFDLYELEEGRVVLVVGDVSGKGVEAAAMASLVKTALAAYAWDFLDPASMVTSLNALFLNFSRLETFSSMVVVSIELASRRAVYCSAGHPPAMLIHRPGGDSPELELLTVQSPIVGAFEGMEYTNGTFEFELGDILYLYTDGTTEARDPQGAFFGEDALRETLLRVCRKGVEAIPRAVLGKIESFSGGDLHDDIAMVAARFDGLPEGEEADKAGKGAGEGESATARAAGEGPLDFDASYEDLFS